MQPLQPTGDWHNFSDGSGWVAVTYIEIHYVQEPPVNHLEAWSQKPEGFERYQAQKAGDKLIGHT